MKCTVNGLVLKVQSVRETGRLVTVLTAEQGLVRAFAHGAKTLTDSKNAATALLCYARLELYQNRKGVWTVSGAHPIESFFALREDVVRLALGMYFCQLAEVFCPEGEPAQEPLRLVLNALHFLCKGRPPAQLKAIVELRLPCQAGFLPDLLGCRDCGAYQAEEGAMYFLPDEGQLACSLCHDKRWALPLGPGALKAMRHIAYADMEKLFGFTVGEQSLRELGAATEAYILKITQRHLETLEFYKTVQQP